MSRAAGGAYTLPAGNPVVTGTIISSTWGNTTLADIATALTDSLSRSGLGGMTAVLLGTDGAVGAPAYSFTNEPTSGLYRIGAGSIGMSVLNRLGMSWAAAGNVTIAAPSSGTALTVNGASATSLIASFVSASGVSPSLTLDSAGGVYSSTLNLNSSAGGGSTIAASQVLQFSTAASVRLSIAAAGSVTINAPSSGATLTLGAGVTTALVVNTTVSTVGLSITDATQTAQVYTSAGNVWMGATSNHILNLLTNNIARLIIASTGNVTINAPSSGTALSVTGIAGAARIALWNGSYSEYQLASATFAYIGDRAGVIGSGSGLAIRAEGQLDLATGGASVRLAIASAGNVTINAPSSGAALTVTGSASTPVNVIGNSSTAFTIDFTKSNVHTVTMTGNVPGGSLTLSNAQDGQTINVFLTQDGTGTRTLGYPAAVKWPSGTAGVLSTAINSVDLLTLTFRSATGFYYASLTKAYS
jgi:hypothetical protein